MPDPIEDTGNSSASAEGGAENLDALFASFATGNPPPNPDQSDQTEEDQGEELEVEDEEEDRDEEQSDEDEGADETPDPNEVQTLEQLRAQNAKLEHKLNSSKGREAAASRKIAELQARIAKDTQEVKRAGADPKARDRAAGLKKLRDEYGDVVGPLVDEVEDIRKRSAAQVRERQEAIDANKAEVERLQLEEEKSFRKEHPDGFDTLTANAEEFEAWIADDNLPSKYQRIFERNYEGITNASEAALLIGKFKEHLAGKKSKTSPNALSQRRTRQLEGAGSDRSSRAPRTTSAVGEGGDPTAMFNAFAGQITKSMGR